MIAHEVGHHVQNLLGVLPRAQNAQRAAGSKAASNRIQVQVELQADCFAGVWAKLRTTLTAQGKPSFIEAGDVEAALRTASAIGDDTLAAAGTGPGGAGHLHPRYVGAAPALVQQRLQVGPGRKLQYLRLDEL